MKNLVLLLFFLLYSGISVFSQSVGIGKEEFTPHSSAALEIRTSEKGILIPRLTQSERDAVTSPATGLLIYQDDSTPGFYYYNGTTWQLLGQISNQNLTLNSTTLSITNGNSVDLSTILGDTPKGDTNPTNATTGDTFYNTTDNTLYVFNGTNWVAVDTDTDGQTLALSGKELSISNGNTVDLTPVLGNTPKGDTNPTTATTGDTFYNTSDNKLYVYNGSNWVAVDTDTDDQTLALSGNELSIADGNSVDLSGISVSTTNITEGAISLSKLEGLADGQIIIGTDGTAVNNSKVVMSGDVTMNNTGVTTIGGNKVTTAKLADNSITAPKLHPMGASTDQFLQWNGSAWAPASVPGTLNYRGAWNASSNSPTLVNGIGTNGDYLVVSVGATRNLGSGNIDFAAGDWAIFNGSIWQRINNSNDVNSVFGRTGVITAQSNDYTWAQIDKTVSSIGEIADVGTATPTSGNFLIADGSSWQSVSPSGDASIAAGGTIQITTEAVTNTKLATNAVTSDKINNGTIATEDISSGGNDKILSTNATGTVEWMDKTTFAASTNTDDQKLTLSGNTLEIENGNSVDLTAILGNPPVGGTNPPSASPGDIYFNTTDHTLYVYDGTSWVPIGNNGHIFSSGTIITVGNHSITQTILNGNVSISQVLHISPGIAPATPREGDIYMDAVSHKLRCYDGTSWQDLW
ncbi:MAG: hypothetical protein ACEPOZ_11390 [Marinifilaceae bacterium]